MTAENERVHSVHHQMIARDSKFVSYLKKRLQHAHDAHAANERDFQNQTTQIQINEEKHQQGVDKAKEIAKLEKKVRKELASQRTFTTTYSGALSTLSRRLGASFHKEHKDRLQQEHLNRFNKQVKTHKAVITPRMIGVSTVLPAGEHLSKDKTRQIPKNTLWMDDELTTIASDDMNIEPPPSRPQSAGISRYARVPATRSAKAREMLMRMYQDSAIDDLSKPSTVLLHGNTSEDRDGYFKGAPVFIPRAPSKQGLEVLDSVNGSQISNARSTVSMNSKF